jgi:hypothetical protein
MSHFHILMTSEHAILNPDVHWLGERFVSHEAVDLCRVEVVDLATQYCLPCSIKQLVQALTDGLQSEFLSVIVF